MKRRTLIQAGSVVLTLGALDLAHGATILTVRVWPAPEYSRVTIESDGALNAKHQFVPMPPRLAVDIEGVTLNPALKELVAKVRADDPNIAGIRVGQFSPTAVRLVLDLKQPIRPQVFALAPVAAYRNRLVLDLYPEKQEDPLTALIAQRLQDTSPAASPVAPASAPLTSTPSAVDPLGELIAQHTQKGAASGAASAPQNATKSIANSSMPTGTLGHFDPTNAAKPDSAAASATDRLIIIALDPGHGGEDPGAIGPGGTREKDVVLRLGHMLRDRINATSVNGNAMRAYMTRDADFFVPLQVRVQKARRVQADLFVSLHAAGCQRICTEPGWSLQQRGSLDGRQGKQGGLDWRRQCANQGRHGATGLAGHEHHRADQRQPQTRRDPAGRNRARGQTPQTACGAGILCGAESAGHSQRAGGSRIHQQPAGRSQTQQ